MFILLTLILQPQLYSYMDSHYSNMPSVTQDVFAIADLPHVCDPTSFVRISFDDHVLEFYVTHQLP